MCGRAFERGFLSEYLIRIGVVAVCLICGVYVLVWVRWVRALVHARAEWARVCVLVYTLVCACARACALV